MKVEYRKAISTDITRCIEIRGLTRDNSLSEEALASIGVTENSWGPLIEEGAIIGNVVLVDSIVVGFCFGDKSSGEILVLAIVAGYEGNGMGKKLLGINCKDLFAFGHSTLWLAASATPVVRAYGFYRKLGWQPTNTFDGNGDEILKYCEK